MKFLANPSCELITGVHNIFPRHCEGKFSRVSTAYMFVCIYEINMFSVKEGQQWWFQLKAMLFLIWSSEWFRKKKKDFFH